MGNVFVDETILKGWADAIRSKLGITTKMKPSELLEKTGNNLVDKKVATDFIENNPEGEYYNEDIKTVRAFGFAGSNFSRVELPNVTYLNRFTFYQCRSLKCVVLPKLTSASNSCFDSCNVLESVELPRLGYVSNGFFSSCTSLTEISLPSLLTCEQTLLQKCSSLVSANLPVLEKSGGISMFSGCKALKTIYAPKLKRITNTSSLFSDCSALEYIELGVGCFTDNVSFLSSPLLTGESIQNIINALATVATEKTLTLHATTKAKLTEAQLTTIRSKNWTVK